MRVEESETLVPIDKLALQVTMICSSVLLIKLLVSNIRIGRARIGAGTRPPEDKSPIVDTNSEAAQKAKQ